MQFTIHTRTLTQSWRFGKGIAWVANTMLFYKEHSPHVTPLYRITGRGSSEGVVTTEDLSPDDYGQVRTRERSGGE